MKSPTLRAAIVVAVGIGLFIIIVLIKAYSVIKSSTPNVKPIVGAGPYSGVLSGNVTISIGARNVSDYSNYTIEFAAKNYGYALMHLSKSGSFNLTLPLLTFAISTNFDCSGYAYCVTILSCGNRTYCNATTHTVEILPNTTENIRVMVNAGALYQNTIP